MACPQEVYGAFRSNEAPLSGMTETANEQSITYRRNLSRHLAWKRSTTLTTDGQKT